MGIGIHTAQRVIEESKKFNFNKGKVLTMGEQDIFFGLDGLQHLLIKNYLPVPDIDVKILRHNNFIDSTSFFKAIGFTEKHSIDYSDYEGCNFTWDFNQDMSQSEDDSIRQLKEQYDVVYDGGTTEHIFDIKTVLKNVFFLLKPGGKIVHHLPLSNYIDHGFYMFSPSLFIEYYMANNYEINTALVHLHPHGDPFADSQRFIPYEQVKGKYWDGNFSSLVFFVATKKEDSTFDVIPQQNKYSEQWEKFNKR